MNTPKLTDLDYIQFLIAAHGVYTCTEAAHCAMNASHDAYTCLLKTAASQPVPSQQMNQLARSQARADVYTTRPGSA